ncbi:hypothetical protein CcCBS67573_g05611 [Chytriomyces confervae]|uniref:Uncharacterized protein n=1 Tax=Chytriomyces confervae TaxID=246404 RepID=A0A507FCW3_9FUNG|nr:hypothetical protein CcCBS67573_g05611 [Chytriomyces confervae]
MAQAPPRILVNPVSPEITLPTNPDSYCTTLNAIPGFKIVQQFGIARGLTVRTPNVGKQVFAGFASLGGGESTVFMEMAEKARETALQRLLEHAGAIGANAIIGMRYDTQEIVQGMTEVLAYGTAVAIVPIN